MKRFFVLGLLMLMALAPAAWADGPDDQYVAIYNLIQQGDSMNERGLSGPAKAKYEEALTTLKKFQTSYPDWNGKVVRYRINYLGGKIAQISANIPVVAVPPATPKTTVPTEPPASDATPAPAVVPAPAPAIAPSSPPQVETPAPAVPLPPPMISPEVDLQIKALQEQVRNGEADKSLLQNKLKEALSAQPAAVDPRELAKAEDRIKELEKENELLKVSLAQARTNAALADPAALAQARQALAEANKKVAQLSQANTALVTERETLLARVKSMAAPDEATAALRAENEILKKEVADLKSKAPAMSPKTSDLNRRLLEAQSQIAVLQSDKEILRLERIALENRVKRLTAAPAAATTPAVVQTLPVPAPVSVAVADNTSDIKIKQLEAQRDELQKNLDAANKELQARKSTKDSTDRVNDLTQQLAALRARIEVFESRQVPYSAEELALFRVPANALVAAAHAPPRKSSKDLPAPNAKLAAEAQKEVASGDLGKAEQTFIQLLALDPKDIVVLEKLSAIQVELDHQDEGEKHIRQALAINPDDSACLAVLGQLRFRQKKYDDALDALGRAAQLSPQDAVIQNFLGLSLSEKGFRGPAETALRKAIQIDPTYASAHNNLAVIYITQKPPLAELARWHYQKAIAAGHPRNLQLEALLEPPKTNAAGQ